MKDWIVGAVGALGAVLGGLVGGWDVSLQVLVLAMAADYITGLFVSFAGKSGKTEGGGFSSNTSFMGLMRKMCIMIVLMLAVALDRFTGAPNVFRLAVCGFYIANEGLSVLENIEILGVDIPPITKALEALRNKHAKPPDVPENSDV